MVSALLDAEGSTCTAVGEATCRGCSEVLHMKSLVLAAGQTAGHGQGGWRLQEVSRML